MTDYIKWIRSKVGNEPIFLNFASAWITNNEGKVLLQKRSADSEIWGFPGGALELGESAEEAVIREVEEETGLKIEVDYLVGIYTKYFDSYVNGDKAQTIVCFFKGRIVGGELKVDHQETFELKFFELEEIPLLFNEQQRDILEDALANRRGVYR